MTDTERKTTRPSHTGYNVPKGKDGKKAFWRETCAAWLHKDGKGFDVVIPDGISLSGRIVFRQNEQ